MLRYISLAERLSAHVRLCNNIILYRRHSGRVPLPRGTQFRFFFLVHIIISPDDLFRWKTVSGGRAGCNAVPCKANRRRRRRRQQCRTPIPRPTDRRRPPSRGVRPARAWIPFGARAPFRSSHIILSRHPSRSRKPVPVWWRPGGGGAGRGMHTYAGRIARAQDAALDKTCVCVCHICT